MMSPRRRSRLRRGLLYACAAFAVLFAMLFVLSTRLTARYETADGLKGLSVQRGAIEAWVMWPPPGGFIVHFGLGPMPGWHFERSRYELLTELRYLDWVPSFSYDKDIMNFVQAEVPIWIPVALALMPLAVAWLRRRRAPVGPVCAACGYNLTGNLSGRCPECGEVVRPAG